MLLKFAQREDSDQSKGVQSDGFCGQFFVVEFFKLYNCFALI